MIRNLLATAAIAALMAGAAHAQDSTKGAPSGSATMPSGSSASGSSNGTTASMGSDKWMSSDLTDAVVYASKANDAERIGEINDLIISKDGNIDQVVIGVGGFLGMGEKNVAVGFSQLEVTADNNGSVYVVLPMSKDQLKNAPAFERREARANRGGSMANNTTAVNSGAGTNTTTGMSSNTGSMSGSPSSSGMANNRADTDASRNAMARANEGLDVSRWSAQKLMGTAVYDTSDKKVGSVGDVIVSRNGSVEAVIVDVGGFLGIGEKPVSLRLSDLKVANNGERDVRLTTSMNRSALEGMPRYDKDKMTSSPDSSRK